MRHAGRVVPQSTDTPASGVSSRGGSTLRRYASQRPLQKDLAQLGRIHPRPGDNLRRRIGREQPGIPHGLQLVLGLLAVLKKQGATMAPSAFSTQTALPHADRSGPSCHASSAPAGTGRVRSPR